jgi:hypothetical protein
VRRLPPRDVHVEVRVRPVVGARLACGCVRPGLCWLDLRALPPLVVGRDGDSLRARCSGVAPVALVPVCMRVCTCVCVVAWSGVCVVAGTCVTHHHTSCAQPNACNVFSAHNHTRHARARHAFPSPRAILSLTRRRSVLRPQQNGRSTAGTHTHTGVVAVCIPTGPLSTASASIRRRAQPCWHPQLLTA